MIWWLFCLSFFFIFDHSAPSSSSRVSYDRQTSADHRAELFNALPRNSDAVHFDLVRLEENDDAEKDDDDAR